MRTRMLLLASLATLALAACGETTIDSDKGETFIRGVVTDQVGAKVKTVSCPDDVKAVKGDMFECQVTGTDGTKGPVQVTQADAEGNVKVDAPFLHVRDAETVIGEQISMRGKTTAKIACPEIVIVAKGEKFDCTGDVGGEDVKLTVTLTDDKGNFTYRAAAS